MSDNSHLRAHLEPGGTLLHGPYTFRVPEDWDGGALVVWYGINDLRTWQRQGDRDRRLALRRGRRDFLHASRWQRLYARRSGPRT